MKLEVSLSIPQVAHCVMTAWAADLRQFHYNIFLLTSCYFNAEMLYLNTFFTLFMTKFVSGSNNPFFYQPPEDKTLTLLELIQDIAADINNTNDGESAPCG